MVTVTWKVTKSEPTACPDMQADPYTGTYPMMVCAVAHFHTVVEDKSKVFDTEKQADEFIKNAPLNCTDFKKLLSGALTEVEERMEDAILKISENPNTLIKYLKHKEK